MDLNRNFPDLDAITFEFERQGINHNNHLLRDVTRLAAPVSADCPSDKSNEIKSMVLICLIRLQ